MILNGLFSLLLNGVLIAVILVPCQNFSKVLFHCILAQPSQCRQCIYADKKRSDFVPVLV